MLQRAFDVAASVWGLVLLGPFMLVVAMLIVLDSRGPVFYRQVRVGRFGAPFRIHKFRTMQVGADARGPQLTVRDDDRVTRVGRVLRRYKIDELPQLIDVALGDMSIVGPRPEVPRYVEHYTPEQRRLLAVRPGITDLASLTYREENDLLASGDDVERRYLEEVLPRKLALSLEHLDRKNLVYDLTIIVATIGRLAGRARSDR